MTDWRIALIGPVLAGLGGVADAATLVLDAGNGFQAGEQFHEDLRDGQILAEQSARLGSRAVDPYRDRPVSVVGPGDWLYDITGPAAAASEVVVDVTTYAHHVRNGEFVADPVEGRPFSVAFAFQTSSFMWLEAYDGYGGTGNVLRSYEILGGDGLGPECAYSWGSPYFDPEYDDTLDCTPLSQGASFAFDGDVRSVVVQTHGDGPSGGWGVLQSVAVTFGDLDDLVAAVTPPANIPQTPLPASLALLPLGLGGLALLRRRR